MQDLPGYEFIRELGRGGMAVVYLATQRSLQRPVALKLLDRNVPGYGELAHRFINEAHTLAGLRHPNIVTVYDVVSSDQGDFISMEYLGNGSLSDRLAVGLTIPQGLSILAKLASALDAAHAHGVVHRDITPDNVLFRDADTPVLTDFGIARRISADSQRVTQAGLAVGTPSYMSPEQIGGDEVDGRADQYSLGAMWYELMTGKPPFEAEHTSDLLLAHLGRPVPLLPPALSAMQPVLERMLAKKPEQRYPDLAGMLDDLARHLMGAPELMQAAPGAPRVSPTERLRQLGFPTTGTQVALPASTRVLPSSQAVPAASIARRWRVPLAAGAVAVLSIAVLFLVLRPGGPLSPAARMPAVAAAVEVPVPDPRSIAVLPFADLVPRLAQVGEGQHGDRSRVGSHHGGSHGRGGRVCGWRERPARTQQQEQHRDRQRRHHRRGDRHAPARPQRGRRHRLRGGQHARRGGQRDLRAGRREAELPQQPVHRVAQELFEILGLG